MVQKATNHGSREGLVKQSWGICEPFWWVSWHKKRLHTGVGTSAGPSFLHSRDSISSDLHITAFSVKFQFKRLYPFEILFFDQRRI